MCPHFLVPGFWSSKWMPAAPRSMNSLVSFITAVVPLPPDNHEFDTTPTELHTGLYDAMITYRSRHETQVHLPVAGVTVGDDGAQVVHLGGAGAQAAPLLPSRHATSASTSLSKDPCIIKDPS
jgi:hypothetical protein